MNNYYDVNTYYVKGNMTVSGLVGISKAQSTYKERSTVFFSIAAIDLPSKPAKAFYRQFGYYKLSDIELESEFTGQSFSLVRSEFTTLARLGLVRQLIFGLIPKDPTDVSTRVYVDYMDYGPDANVIDLSNYLYKQTFILVEYEGDFFAFLEAEMEMDEFDEDRDSDDWPEYRDLHIKYRIKPGSIKETQEAYERILE